MTGNIIMNVHSFFVSFVNFTKKNSNVISNVKFNIIWKTFLLVVYKIYI